MALRDKIFKRIFDVAEISSLDDEDKKNYINYMQTARDTYNQLEYAKKKGREEGLEKGLKQGRREIATNMLRNGLSIQTICDCTRSLSRRNHQNTERGVTTSRTPSSPYV